MARVTQSLPGYPLGRRSASVRAVGCLPHNSGRVMFIGAGDASLFPSPSPGSTTPRTGKLDGFRGCHNLAVDTFFDNAV